MNWARILAFVTGMVDKELLARSEYLVAENRILKAQLKGRLRSELRSPRSVIAWAARSSPRWPMWRGLTPSWLGTASLSPASLMARRLVRAPAGLGLSERLSN
jgi:hypothetical protein